MEYFFPITSLIIHNYKYIYYKSIYNFCNFAPSLIKNGLWIYPLFMEDSLKKRVLSTE